MRTTNHSTGNSIARQSGAALVISLIVLVVLTLIGIDGMRSSTMEERMAGNMRDRDMAFQAAEAALRDSETYFGNMVSTGAFNGTDGLLGLSDSDPDFFASGSWVTNNSVAYSGTISGVNSQPRYILKYIGETSTNVGSLNIGGYGTRNMRNVTNFRTVARGTGSSDTAQVLLQSYFGKVL